MSSEVTIGGDRPDPESEPLALRLVVSVLPAIVFVAVLYPMFGYTGRIVGWGHFAPVTATAIVFGRLLYSVYQMAD